MVERQKFLAKISKQVSYLVGLIFDYLDFDMEIMKSQTLLHIVGPLYFDLGVEYLVSKDDLIDAKIQNDSSNKD